MQLDYALILSAGLGTRMGIIGKTLPKVMWPILDTPIIDLQIKYCKKLGVKRIFINTHFLADQIKNHIIKKYGNEITILHEEVLLDSGGAIHNLAEHPLVNYTGNLLMVNGDQFLLFSETEIFEKLKRLKTARAILFGINVNKDEKYNETLLQNNRLVNIEKPIGTSDFTTYSGLGLLRLNGLNKVHGPSKFFQTVTNYTQEEVLMFVPEKYEYWDFGTADAYFKNILKLKSPGFTETKFSDFLKDSSVKLSNSSDYISLEKNAIRLTTESDFQENSIVKNDLTIKI
jgi:choline kinase